MSPALVIVASLLACGDEIVATQVMVIVDAEPGVRGQTESLRIVVEGMAGENESESREPYDRVLTNSDFEWPYLVALQPLGGDATRPYEIVATSLDGDGDFVAQVRAISGYVSHKRLELRLLLEKSCIGKDECDSDQTCRAGTCRSARIAPADLLEFNGNTVAPDSGGRDGADPDGGGSDYDASTNATDGSTSAVDSSASAEDSSASAEDSGGAGAGGNSGSGGTGSTTCNASDCTCTGGAPGNHVCEGECVDTETDIANCGQCGTTCETPLSCIGGECACPLGGKLCDGECLNTQSDDANCGDCGMGCDAPATCMAGECECPTAGEFLCEGMCITGDDDKDNCGSCGNDCAGAQECCNGTCVNVQGTDKNNCGMCGTVCSGTSDRCTAGVCKCNAADACTAPQRCYALFGFPPTCGN